MNPRLVKISKLLSLILRHRPEAFGLELDASGWAGVDELIAACARRGETFSRDELLQVVDGNDKQRFALSPDGRRIRASQADSRTQAARRDDKGRSAPLPADHVERMARARLCLDGLSVGDAFGERFFGADWAGMIKRRQTPEGPWHVTDDTVMAMSICDVINRHGRVDRDDLARMFAERYMRDPKRDLRSYGGGAHHILMALADGLPWQVAAGVPFGAQGSMGNGGAMRAGPVGAYFADNLDALIDNARSSAMVTHSHPDGQAGAIAAAVAAAMAYRTRTLEPSSAGRELMETVLRATPAGMTRDGLVKASALPLETEAWSAACILGSGDKVISSDTVPFAVWCAAKHLDDYREALWATVSGLGDRDTTCAIVGSIVAMRAGREGIPAEWLSERESLDM